MVSRGGSSVKKGFLYLLAQELVGSWALATRWYIYLSEHTPFDGGVLRPLIHPHLDTSRNAKPYQEPYQRYVVNGRSLGRPVNCGLPLPNLAGRRDPRVTQSGILVWHMVHFLDLITTLGHLLCLASLLKLVLRWLVAKQDGVAK